MKRSNYLAGGAAAVVMGIGLGVTSGFSFGEGDIETGTYSVLNPVMAMLPADTMSAEEEVVPEWIVRATEIGSASFYANSLAGRRTASGVPYNPREMVAAHRTLPFGSLLRVTNQANGETVEVRVVDRGPFARGRVLDLSRAAAERLGFIRQGHTRVTIEVLEEAGEAES